MDEDKKPDKNTPMEQVPGYEFLAENPKPNSTTPVDKTKPLLIGTAVLACVLILIGAVAYFALSQKNDNSGGSKSDERKAIEQLPELVVKIPDDWKKIDTSYSFSVKVPPGWEEGETINLSFNKIEGEVAILNLEQIDETNDESENADTESISEKKVPYLSAGSQQLADSTDKDSYESALTNTSEKNSQLAEILGVKAEELKTSSSKLKINGKEWLQVNSEANGKFWRLLSRWVDERAILVIATDTNSDKNKFEEYTKQYLLPVAASLELRAEESN